ncbi:MAG: helix-turn-helix domain-containing protein, partial [Bacteroidota bacterium]
GMTQQVLNFDAAEQNRRDCNKTRVLDRLRKGPATNVELAEAGGYRFGGRIHELRQEGFVIQKRRIDGGLFMYELVGER